LSLTERRRAPRFELKLPVVIRWRDGAEMREALTVSNDVSSKGIYFLLPEGKNGTPVEVEMTLPQQISPSGPVRVRCLGRIQRYEVKDAAHAGMAAEIEKYEFIPNSSGEGQSSERSVE
jgi:hypothetical protein